VTTLTVSQAIKALLRTPLLTIEQARALLITDRNAHGMYSWWLTEANALPCVPTTPHPTERVGLLYIGVGPGTAGSNRTLPKRFADHTKEASRSTLRYGLASFLYAREGWTPCWHNKRPLLADPDSDALSVWMATNLRVQLAHTFKPLGIEREVVQRMRPPLNRTHNQSHPFYKTVGDARKAFRAAARGNKTGFRDR
jgi:hypothetical protein